jgi:hypothetical protein
MGKRAKSMEPGESEGQRARGTEGRIDPGLSRIIAEEITTDGHKWTQMQRQQFRAGFLILRSPSGEQAVRASAHSCSSVFICGSTASFRLKASELVGLSRNPVQGPSSLHISLVGTRVSERKCVHSLTLAATTQSGRSKLQGIGPIANELMNWLLWRTMGLPAPGHLLLA